MALSEALRAHIRTIVDSHRVVLFMKGTRLSPQCGFSATAVAMLDALLPEYRTVDVMADPTLREGLREYSEWPTFPQLYVGGTFMGGTDILQELQSQGELARALGVEGVTVKLPALTITARAASVLREAMQDAEGLVLRFEVSSGFRYGLSFADAQPGDLVVGSEGLSVHLDPGSAHRADGTTIDYVVGSKGAGFHITNPNEPERVRALTPEQAKAKLAGANPPLLVDVRTPTEWGLARIEGARLLDAAFEHELLAMDRATPLIFQCHHGVRSQAAAEHFLGLGFREVYNLEGGIDAWSLTVDRAVPRY